MKIIREIIVAKCDTGAPKWPTSRWRLLVRAVHVAGRLLICVVFVRERAWCLKE